MLACLLGCHRKANQDKLRHELARAEFADVTFQPKINSRSKAMSRSVANLTRYVRASHVHTQRSMLRFATADTLRLHHQGEVRRIRRKQRARIIQEVEDRELTFSPQINKQSLRVRTTPQTLSCPSSHTQPHPRPPTHTAAGR